LAPFSGAKRTWGANVEFLQLALNKLDRETRDRIATANRDLSDARAEIAALK
jgi:hypothetical protein